MARVDVDVIDRVVRFAHRMQDVAEAVAASVKRRSFRIVEQISACGTSVAANLYEADEAVSRMDFVKCVGICVKELNECRFWLRFVGERGWVEPKRLKPLATEAHELIKVFGSMIARIRRAEAAKKKVPSRRTNGPVVP